MRRPIIGVLVGGMVAATVGGMAAQPGLASSGIAAHRFASGAPRTVNVATLPRAIGNQGGVGRQMPLGTFTRGGSTGAASQVAADSNQPLLSITGGTKLTPALKQSDNSTPLTPPDMGVGADATHVVQMVNVVGKIWTNHVAGSAFSLSAFFLAGTDFVSDPWVLYDQESGHWFSGIFDVTLGGEKIGVSQTGDPTGSWFIYSIQYPGQPGGGCPDQGKGGVDTDIVALGFNEFANSQCSGGGGSFLGAALEEFNKSQMIVGASASGIFTNPIAGLTSLIPAQALSAGQTTEYYVANDTPSGASTALHRLVSTGVPPGTVNLAFLADLSLAHSYPSPPSAVQKGSTMHVASGDARVQHVVWKAGVGLLTTWTEACKPSGDATTRDCARVVETNDGVGGPSVIIDKDLAKKGQYYYYPAGTLNSANDVIVDFNVSSSGLFPSLDAAAGTQAGVFGLPITLAKGTTANTTGRFGDYNAVALDPSGATPNQNVWAAGEIGGPTAGFDWQTAVREVNVTP